MPTYTETQTVTEIYQIDNETGILTGVIKSNVVTDPDYIPPITDIVYETKWVPVEETAICQQL